LLRDDYPSLARISDGALEGVPALVIGGTGDRTVPIDQSRKVAAALGASIYEVDGADHNDSSIRSAPSMVGVVSDFIFEAIGQ
jgi:pimeloyl-ACP methyl ester carboxylesterase